MLFATLWSQYFELPFFEAFWIPPFTLHKNCGILEVGPLILHHVQHVWNQNHSCYMVFTCVHSILELTPLSAHERWTILLLEVNNYCILLYFAESFLNLA